MSSLFKRLFSSSSSPKSLARADSDRNKDNNDNNMNNGGNNHNNEQMKKKLLRRLALAENDPEPLLDLSDSELTKVNDQILTLIKVYHKYRVHLERNQLSTLTIPLSSKHFTDVTVLHLEENQICSFQLDSHSSLPNLKELYLSKNRLSSLPTALFQLPRLRVLVLRENRLVDFPVSILSLSSLTYCDLAYNRIVLLPASLLSSVSLDTCSSLETLILEGNPLSRPTFEQLATACQGDDVTSFAQIDAALRQYYQVVQAQQNHIGGEQKKESGDAKKSVSTKNNVDFDVETNIEQKKIANYITNAAVPSKGDDDQHKNDDSSSDEDDLASDDCFTRYEQQKLANKQNAIEWERNYMNAQLEQDRDTNTEVVGRVTCKDKLLHQLHSEQDSLFAKINQFHDRKDAEKQKMLDKCIEQLQEHSSLLIEKLSHDIGQKAFDSAGGEDDLGAELNYDISQLLAQYDANLDLKRAGLLNELVENDQEESVKLAQSFRRKDDQHQSRFKELERHEESLSLAFDTILAARDRRNEDLTEKILLVEQELLALTFVERERKDVKSDQLLADLVAQRTQLAQLLSSLLEVKRHREKQLMETLEKELSKRFCTSDNSDDSWLQEFQRLLSKEPFEVQLAQYGIDVRIGDILAVLYHELDDDQAHRHGSMLQCKLVYYLGHFVDIPLDRLFSSSAEDLLKLNIDDYELCQLIVDRFGRYTKQTDQPVTASQVVNLNGATAPNEIDDDDSPKKLLDSSEHDEEQEEQTDKFWCEAECVICLDNKSNIVFLPCGHICTCQRCIRPNACPLSLCPLCRAEIDFMQSINI